MKKEINIDFGINKSGEKDTREGKISENLSNDSNRLESTPEEGSTSVLGTRVLEALEVLTSSLTASLAHFFSYFLSPRVVYVTNRSASD